MDTEGFLNCWQKPVQEEESSDDDDDSEEVSCRDANFSDFNLTK